MAIFFPDIETIKTLKQKPTVGERHALEMLKDFSDEYEIYFQPYINGHNPDIILIRKNYGVLIIEVKDWRLEYYNVEQNDKWSLKKDGTPIKSPIKQVKKYKDDLFDLSIDLMFKAKIREKIDSDTQKTYGIVQTAVYFYNETAESIKNKNIKVDDFCPVFGNDNFTKNSMMNQKNTIRKYQNKFFTDNIYTEFQRILKPSFHTLEQAKIIELTPQQKKLSRSDNRQQKIRGIAGSGKTLVLAQRAVNAHIRHQDNVLILTYNITLRNFIHDNLSRVRQEFYWNNFHISHFHGFIGSNTNNLNIQMPNFLDDCNDEYLFENVKDKITKYQSIFIDEIQDYKESWVKLIKKYFLVDNGEFVVFGDEKQNIYDNKLDNDKKPYTGIPGAWSKLNQSFRLSNKILELAENFQKKYFTDKYEIEKAIPKQQTLSFEEESIEYFKLDNDILLSSLSTFLLDTMKFNSIQHQDVCILAQSNGLLREIDFEIRQTTRQKTFTTLETKEMYDKLKEQYTKESSNNTKNLDNLKSEIRQIQINKRFNFWMNSAGIKLSSINSFKGWEINTLFLIIDGKSDHETNEKIYTAMTRCRSRLFILNIDHTEYDSFFTKHLKPKTLPNNIVKIDEQSNRHKKTIGETIANENISDFRFNFAKLKANNNFNILVIGEISGEKTIFQEALNNSFGKFGIRADEWDIEFWNNKALKRKDIRGLRKGQTKYTLIMTGQIHQHSTKGNKEANLFGELSKPNYIKMIHGSKPQSVLTPSEFVDKLHKYISSASQQNI